MEPVLLLIADAQHLVRLGIRQLLVEQPQYRIVGEATCEEELADLSAGQSPRVVIVDYHQPGHFSPASILRIKELYPNANILVISADSDRRRIFQVLEGGVQSFLTKTCGEEEVLDAIKATARGEKFFCTRIIDYLLEKTLAREEESCAPTPLSAREIEIVQLIAQGYIAKEIADRLNLSTHTIYTHRKNIMKKLQLNSSSELVLYAVNSGILEGPEQKR